MLGKYIFPKVAFMLKRVLIAAITAVTLSGCIWHHPVIAEKSKPQMLTPTTVVENTQEFTKLKISGKIDVTIHTGYNAHKIIFHGMHPDIVKAHHYIKYGELSIDLGKGFPKYGLLKIDIYMRKLTALSYNGAGNILAQRLSANCLDVDINNPQNTSLSGAFGLGNAKFSGNGNYQLHAIASCPTNLVVRDKAQVRLSGYFNIANLNMGDDSFLNLYWVKSKNLKIKLKDNAHAQLSGVAAMVDAELWDKSYLDSRHLLATNSFVKTHDYAEAHIAVLKNQHTLAKDKSNIYYYALPEKLSDFMAKDGSVLDMREWHLASP